MIRDLRINWGGFGPPQISDPRTAYHTNLLAAMILNSCLDPVHAYLGTSFVKLEPKQIKNGRLVWVMIHAIAILPLRLDFLHPTLHANLLSILCPPAP